MRGLIVLGLLTVLSLSSRDYAEAPDADTLRDRLRLAETASSINAEGLLPWHVKLDVQLFDEQGKPKENGTIEGWWAAPDLTRVTFSFPSYRETEIHNQNGFFRTRGLNVEPALLQDVLEQVVHPMTLDDLAGTRPELRKQKFGKVGLECIMLDEPLKNVSFPPLGLFPTYCLDPGKESLRISTELGSGTFVRNRVGTFQGRSVAVDLSAQVGEYVVAKAHISTLAGMKESEMDFTPTADMESAPQAVARVGPGVMAGSILTKVQPVYPQAAKEHRVQGSVVLNAAIGRDGRIRQLHVKSTPDPDLAMAAIAAVRQWTYKPYLLNGLPTEVDTTITVNFSFGPG